MIDFEVFDVNDIISVSLARSGLWSRFIFCISWWDPKICAYLQVSLVENCFRNAKMHKKQWILTHYTIEKQLIDFEVSDVNDISNVSLSRSGLKLFFVYRPWIQKFTHKGLNKYFAAVGKFDVTNGKQCNVHRRFLINPVD